jgi:hypothetical protein
MNEDTPASAIEGDMDRLKLTGYIEQGSPGIDDDPSNPLSRAVNRLFEKGRPFSRMGQCFFGDLASSLTRSTPLRWLGVFILSAGEQVLFFPGFAALPTGIESFRGQPPRHRHDDPAFPVDHVSLEKDRTQSHFTTPRSKDHLRHWPTYPLEGGRFLWFGMSVARETAMRELKRETIVTTYTPPSDSRRRVEVFHQAQNDAEHLWASLHPEARSRFEEGFFHFAVMVGPKEFPLYEGNQLDFPFGSPFLSEPLLPEALEQLPIRHHRLSLGSSIDIQIVTMWLPGTLRVPFSFNGATS